MRQEGFSLIELLIVVTIIGVLSAIVVIRGDLFQASTHIDSSAQQLINLSKLAKQDSISVAEYYGIFPSYGLYLNVDDPHSVIIYVNCKPDDNEDGIVNHNDNFAYNSDASQTCEEVIGSGAPSDASKVDEIAIENSVFIYEMEVSIDGEDPFSISAFSINYLRPEPTVWITYDNGSENVVSSGYVKVTLRDRTEKYEKDVIFYTSAFVDTSSRRRVGTGG